MSIPCPNSYYTYPNLIRLAEIPKPIFSTLDHLWKRSIHPGRNVDIYRFSKVFVVSEGLVFDESSRLIDVTKTYHTDHEIVSAAAALKQALATSKVVSLPKGILAKSRGASNYGHFLIEMLPRAWLARNRLQLAGWPAIIDALSAAVQNVSTQALHQAGFGLEEVIATGHEPVFVEELIAIDGLTSHSQYLSPIVMQCLDAIADAIPAGDDARIYAPRRPAKVRDFANEPEIAARLRKEGFRETLTGEMPFTEQIRAFKGADTVAGVTGAALTNVAFCRPGTRVFNFSPSGAAEVLFWMIAESRRLKYLEIRCPEGGPQRGNLSWDRSLMISPDEVGLIVNTL